MNGHWEGRKDAEWGGRTLNGEDGNLIGRMETLRGWTPSGEDGHLTED